MATMTESVPKRGEAKGKKIVSKRGLDVKVIKTTGGKYAHSTAKKKLPKVHSPTGDLPKGLKIEVTSLRKELGVSQAELARLTGYSIRSIAGWEGGKALSEPARQKLTETERLRAALSELLPPAELGEWMRAPNPSFEGQTPMQVIERGESDRLWQMIFEIDANVAN